MWKAPNTMGLLPVLNEEGWYFTFTEPDGRYDNRGNYIGGNDSFIMKALRDYDAEDLVIRPFFG